MSFDWDAYVCSGLEKLKFTLNWFWISLRTLIPFCGARPDQNRHGLKTLIALGFGCNHNPHRGSVRILITRPEGFGKDCDYDCRDSGILSNQPPLTTRTAIK